ncbi:GNAT family N-acetyltransferase [Bacillus altitudinis]|uniref:GNAT family N-acetyltransferase n=1 Tax=Bacillus altitudinis TaxID=293387 RepID=UPI001C3EFF4D|nr:GNAT family N-acetyltransferase [Bacillus altitudinis]MDH3108189.1 GNAT family N-acetyltransferase [Bacillus altitudinis]QXJ48858.1 GNAT family N-acetyltransferase [Bacillus altitudinis]WJE30159.1 GNAT family N-acetyltransferase [Bacillus altitudinis]
MNKLNDDILENIYKNISTKRSKTIVNYIAMLMALARDHELNEDDLINWIHSKLSAIGYFQEKNRLFTQNKLDEFVVEFIEGRALLYDDINITETKQNEYVISSKLWYKKNPPESFFHFGIDPEDFSNYAQKLAQINAEKLGISINFSKDQANDNEIAHIQLSKKCSLSEELTVTQPSSKDFSWLTCFFNEHWGGTTMVSKGTTYNVLNENIMLAKRGDTIVGILVYKIFKEEAEILTLEALEKYHGVGSKLLFELEQHLKTQNIQSINLITSNDNLNAIRFYQRKGYSFKNIYIGAIDKARMLKPTIPSIGNYGINVKDELEFEKRLIR